MSKIMDDEKPKLEREYRHSVDIGGKLLEI